MTPRPSTHPEHALEQAYIEKVHVAVEQARAHADRTAEAAGDKFAARSVREHMLERLKEPVDLDALCFGRIDQATGRTFYLGRGAVHDEHGKLLVVNWRMPVAAAFYTADSRDPQGLALRRRFQLDQLRLLGIVDDTFGDDRPSVQVAPSGKSTNEAVPTAVETAPPTNAGDQSDEITIESTPPPRESEQVDSEQVDPEVMAGALPDLSVDAAAPTIEPHVVDAILADMDRARGTEMRDIVATIEGSPVRADQRLD